LSHSIFVSFCAFGLTFQTFLLFKLPLVIPVCWLVFFLTLGAYNLYWIVSKWTFKRDNANFSDYVIHFILLVLSAVAATDYLWGMPYLVPYILIGGILTSLYTLLISPFSFLPDSNKLGFIKTILLAITWSFVTIFLPCHQFLQTQFSSVMMLFFTRFIFVLFLCIIFDSRDIAKNRIQHLHSLATDVMPKNLRIMMFLFLIAYIFLLSKFGFVFQDTRQSIVLGCSGVFSFLLYFFTYKKRSYFFYYFIVDGLMLFSAFASYLLTI